MRARPAIRRGEYSMPITEARKKANRKWDAQNRDRYWACLLRFPAADRPVIVARAESQGMTVSDYIRGLVYADLSQR